MTASAIERVLARAFEALSAASIATTVTRRRSDAFSTDELSAIEILRGSAESDVHGDRADRWRIHFDLQLYVIDDEMAETALDSLWQAATAALQADPVMASLCKGLRCSGTAEPEQIAINEGVAARMTCGFEAQLLTRRADVALAIT